MNKIKKGAPSVMSPKRPTGAELQEYRELHQLTQAQLAALAHVNVRRNRAGGMQSSTVQGWERSGGMPESTWELLQVKLLLLREGACSLKELLETPLDVLVQKILRSKRRKTASAAEVLHALEQRAKRT